jgi:hypothetical protein
MTTAEANFAAEIRTWNRARRIAVLRSAGLHVGAWQSKAELASLLLAIYQQRNPPGTQQDPARATDAPTIAAMPERRPGAKLRPFPAMPARHGDWWDDLCWSITC